MQIGFIGAGNVARALGARFHAAGHDVVFSSREHAVPGFGRTAPAEQVAASSDVVVLAVPFSAARDALPPLADRLAGKVVVDATNPVNVDWSPMLLGQDNSAGEEIARLLPRSRVVKAFNTIFADVMAATSRSPQDDRVTCFVASDDDEAGQTVARLASAAGFSPRLAGPLRMARHLESLAHLNIQLAVGMGGGTHAAFSYHPVP